MAETRSDLALPQPSSAQLAYYRDADAENIAAETRTLVKAAADRAAAAPWPSLTQDFAARTFAQ